MHGSSGVAGWGVWRPGTSGSAPLTRRRRNPFRRRLQPLFHQQCWCWGEDIRRSEGNLLLGRGFTRERGGRASRYHLAEAGLCITLWGFGATVGTMERGGIFIDRLSLRLKLGPATPPETWSAAALLGYHYPRTHGDLEHALALFARFAAWVADYEEWVPTVTHPCYRVEVLSRWDDAVVRAEAMAATWRRAAEARRVPGLAHG